MSVASRNKKKILANCESVNECEISSRTNGKQPNSSSTAKKKPRLFFRMHILRMRRVNINFVWTPVHLIIRQNVLNWIAGYITPRQVILYSLSVCAVCAKQRFPNTKKKYSIRVCVCVSSVLSSPSSFGCCCLHSFFNWTFFGILVFYFVFFFANCWCDTIEFFKNSERRVEFIHAFFKHTRPRCTHEECVHGVLCEMFARHKSPKRTSSQSGIMKLAFRQFSADGWWSQND